jgi:protein-S-isoprenylcysteine O-methyltransferase Ste14
MKKNDMPSKVSTIIRTVTTILFIIAALFIPAGTFNWPGAWAFLVLYLAMVTAALIWMKKKAPGLLKERMSRNKDMKSWDKRFMIVYSFCLIFLLVVPGLDAVRFQWSDVPLTLKVLGFLGFLPGMLLAFWAVKENAYASDVVRIQEDRGHKVCKTGPYRYVRHPMYAGVILILLCYPLSLGSLYTFIPASIIIALFVLRTALEDNTLQVELIGYIDYAQKVRFRLIPGIW